MAGHGQVMAGTRWKEGTSRDRVNGGSREPGGSRVPGGNCQHTSYRFVKGQNLRPYYQLQAAYIRGILA